jgi:hypothetical protein
MPHAQCPTPTDRPPLSIEHSAFCIGSEYLLKLAFTVYGHGRRFRMMDRLTADRIGEVLAENADNTCRLITDEYSGYRSPGRAFAGGHETVAHSGGEYVRRGTDVHSNTIEGVFVEVRWNTRKMDDGQRVSRAIRQIEGKRLEYLESVDNPPYLVKLMGQRPAPFQE